MRPARLFLALCCLMLAGCGFQPLYGKVDDREIEVGTYLASIKIDRIGGANGQRLKNMLEDRLNPNAQPSLYGHAFRLVATLKLTRDPVIIEPDGSISRYSIHIVSTFRLIDEDSKQVIHSGTVRRLASFNVAAEKFAAYVAEREAIERALAEMSEDYRMRLAAFFAQHYKLSAEERTVGR